MKVMLFGASGMVGAGVLLECLEDSSVTEVMSIGRTPLAVNHAKLSEHLTKDLYSLDALRSVLAEINPTMTFTYVSGEGTDSSEKEIGRAHV